MKIKQYQVDAFADRAFEGNPAAVCPLDNWLEDNLLQSIAEENNLSETAFFVQDGEDFQLRWFTPVKEVDLCGHATLASAHVLYEKLGYSGSVVNFHTRSGLLSVKNHGEELHMDFPACLPIPSDVPDHLVNGLGVRPSEVLKADDYLAVFDSEETIRSITPNISELEQLDLRGIIVTAKGDDFDFVSRFFAPKYGIPEDPVTGSAHCVLAPYWAEKLGKTELTAKQLSKRGGALRCKVIDNRVQLLGRAVIFMEGEITFS